MSSSDIGSVYFWRIIHSAFKHDDSDEEKKRSTAVVRWVYQNRQALEDSLSPAEFIFLKPILQTYEIYTTSLSPKGYRDTIEEESGKSWKVLDELFNEYQDLDSDLTVYVDSDMPQLLRGVVGISLQSGMEAAWGDTKKILTSDPKIKVQGEEKMTRYEKAYSHMRSQLVSLSSKIAYLDDSGNRDLQVVRDADQVRENYVTKKDIDQDEMAMPIGLPLLDEEFRTKRGHFFGLLGFAGHRKSTLGRTWCYNTLARGHNIGHWALEMGADDEFSLYHLIHCHKKYGPKGFSKSDFEKGKLNPLAEELFYRATDSNQMAEDLRGEIFYHQRGLMSWFELAKEIDDAIEQNNITMAYVDYLTLVDVPSKGNDREAINRMIQAVKPFAESRKILIVTPIQGNRDGLERASDRDGQWDPSGIDTYSGYFRALDGIIGVYSPQETPYNMQLSMVKNRHGALLDPVTANVCPDTGYITL